MPALMIVTAALLVFAQTAAAAPADIKAYERGATSIAYAADGRLAVAIRGDLWIQATGDGGRWLHITSGPAWDREPAWSADGSALIFASDRGGNSDLWRVRVGPAGAVGEPERLTASPEWEGEPTAAADGAIIFVRGRGPVARLWIKPVAGAERRLTKETAGAERWPAVSPDGKHVAYVSVREGGNQLRVRLLAGDSDRVVLRDKPAEHPAWSPAGDRIVFATRNGRAGVWITTPDNRYTNLVSARRASAVWSPDGRKLALVELPGADLGYNGDPDRLGGRDVHGSLPSGGHLWLVDAPTPPDAGAAEVAVAATADRKAVNGEMFDRDWSRVGTLYYKGAPDAMRQWEALEAKYRPRALAAGSDDELRTTVHEMMRERPPLRQSATGRAAVSSAHPVATAAGLEILSKGGNVVDAAVAVSFALGVVEPDASGVGGYGQMLINKPSMTQPAVVEFMTRVPEEASLENAALLRNGQYPDDGPMLPNVPGTVAAMHLAWTKYGSGKVKWADLLAPAIRAATDGYVVSEGLATTLATEREHFMKYESSRALFFRNGEPLHAGDTLRNPDLAWTLRQIAEGGANAFYRGEVARRIVSDLRGKGNAMRLSDLARYYAAEREPVSGTYRGYTLYSSTPPSAGGATLVAQLNMIEALKTPRLYTEDAATLHAMVEAWKLVPGGRGRIADPGLWPVHIEAYTSKDSARARWACFDPKHSLSPDDVRGDSLPCARGKGVPESPARVGQASSEGQEECEGREQAVGARFCHKTGTTAFAVADADGNAVAVTQTLGTWGGNFYVTPGLGFLYNDKLTSYGTNPDDYGARLPNARHGSTLAPTIVFRGVGAARRPVLAAGAAGNAWITSAVYSIVTGVLDDGLSAQQALELPRFLISQDRGDAKSDYVIEMEDGFAPSVLREMEARGHRIRLISFPGEVRMGYGAAITIGEGHVTAGADPRRAGAAGAVGCKGKADALCER